MVDSDNGSYESLVTQKIYIVLTIKKEEKVIRNVFIIT